MTIVGDDSDGFLVVFRQCSGNESVAVSIKRNPLPDTELHHRSMRPHLRKEPQTLDNAMVQIHQFFFGQFVDVDCH